MTSSSIPCTYFFICQFKHVTGHLILRLSVARVTSIVRWQEAVVTVWSRENAVRSFAVACQQLVSVMCTRPCQRVLLTSSTCRIATRQASSAGRSSARRQVNGRGRRAQVDKMPKIQILNPQKRDVTIHSATIALSPGSRVYDVIIKMNTILTNRRNKSDI